MVEKFTKKQVQQLLLLLLMYFAFFQASGQENTESSRPQYKRIIFGVDVYTFGFYSYSMMADTDQMEAIRGNSLYLTIRMRPQVALQFQGNFLRATNLTDVKSSHLFGGLKLSSNASRRLQAYITPGVGFGSYQTGYDYSDFLMDFGGTGGLDLHIGQRFVLNYSVHYRANIDLEPFFFSGLGLSIKL